MPKIAFEAARKWFEAVILASCRLLMKTLIVIIISIMIIAKYEETVFAFILDVFIIHRLTISKFPDFYLNPKISWAAGLGR